MKMDHSIFDDAWRKGHRAKPNIRVLAIRRPDSLDKVAVEWILVERQETCRLDERDGSVHEASIRLAYRQLAARYADAVPHRGEFCASYHSIWNTLSLTSSSLSGGAVFLDPPSLRGNRLGTYLMNEIVDWARNFPDASVNPVTLIDGQAYAANKERRNRFYEQFGLVFDYNSEDRSAGVSRPMLAGELNIVETWRQNITEHKFFDYLADVLQNRDEAVAELELRTSACKALNADRRAAESRPLWWALKTLYWRHSGELAIAGMLSLLGVAVWWRIGM
jgi:GNAT superfamily N-acetyltransferase